MSGKSGSGLYLNLTFDEENGYVLGTSRRKPGHWLGWLYTPREAVRLPESIAYGNDADSLFEDGPVSHLYAKYFSGNEHLKRGELRIKKKNILNCHSMKLPLPESGPAVSASEFFEGSHRYPAH